MIQKVASVVLVSVCLLVAACNTVRGAAADVDSAANCTQNAAHGSRC